MPPGFLQLVLVSHFGCQQKRFKMPLQLGQSQFSLPSFLLRIFLVVRPEMTVSEVDGCQAVTFRK